MMMVVMRGRWVGRVAPGPHNGHHFLSPNVADVSLLSLLLGIGKLDNQRSLRTLHDFDAVQLFNGLDRCVAADKTEKGGALAGPVCVADHVDFLNLTKLPKELFHVFLFGFA